MLLCLLRGETFPPATYAALVVALELYCETVGARRCTAAMLREKVLTSAEVPGRRSRSRSCSTMVTSEEGDAGMDAGHTTWGLPRTPEPNSADPLIQSET